MGCELSYAGVYRPCSEMLRTKQVVIPDTWGSVEINSVGASMDVLAFPEEMYSLNLHLEYCSNLKAIVLPKMLYKRTACASIRISLENCNNIRELIVPRSNSPIIISVSSCANLTSIRSISDNMVNTSGHLSDRVVITMSNCPRLQIEKHPNWRIARTR